jgi:hypothetical protein
MNNRDENHGDDNSKYNNSDACNKFAKINQVEKSEHTY